MAPVECVVLWLMINIVCDKCPLWFHDSTICMGLPQTAIQALKDVGGEGILFVCTDCRVGKGNNSRDPTGAETSGGNGNNGAMMQLHETVRAQCASVRSLTNQVTNTTCVQSTTR